MKEKPTSESTSPGTTRRSFLTTLGLSAAALAACERLPVRHAMPYLVPPEEITPGVPTFYASTCTACPAGCGTLVRVLDGRPVKLEGNPDHPLSRGGLCAIGQAQLRSLYDPERLQAPRLNGTNASWEEVDAFVRERLSAVSRDGQSVRLLSPTITSPTARRLIEDFLRPYQGVWIEHDVDPQAPSALLEVYEILAGHSLTPFYDFERVDLLVSLGADPFGTGAEPVTHTGGWAERRRQSTELGAPRHVQIEASLSLTGAGADERWLASASEREHLSLWILRRLAESSERDEARILLEALGETPSPPETERAEVLVEELLAHRGRSLLLSGSNQLAEQMAIALANRLLDNEGETLDLDRPSLVRRGVDRNLEALEQEISEGSVGALFIIDLDAVGRLTTPAGLAQAIGQLPLSVVISERASATSEACHVVAAAHHPLESWSDVEARRGWLTVAQPTIRPIFDTRDRFESFLRWSDDAAVADWRAYLKRSWQEGRASAESDPERWWTESVRTAGLSDTETWTSAITSPSPGASETDWEKVVAPLQRETRLSPQADGLEVELVSEVALRNGNHLQNPWLRELPDPLTRVAWTPCARFAPRAAESLGISDGSIVEVRTDAGAVRMAARILPGQHPAVVAIPIGYSGEANAHRLTAREGGLTRWDGSGAQVTPTGERVELPLMQVHSEVEGRPIIHQVSRPDEAVHGPHHPDASLWPGREKSSPHWEMVIDLNACSGCAACVVACQVENNIPGVGEEQFALHRDMHWLRVDRYFEADGENQDVLFQPMLCAQCDRAPCETVCPVAATVHSEDGLNQQIYNRCVGTRYCANNCPYKVRRYNWFDFQPSDALERMVLNPDVVVRSRGVMEKCTFCVQRIQSERIAARRENRESFEVATACQQSCPAQAITFGDVTDNESDVVRLKKEPRAFQVLAELGIEPSVTYLARVRSRLTEATGPTQHDEAEDHGGDS